MSRHLRQQALRLHQRLPDDVWDQLREYGLEDTVIHAKLLGFDGRHLTVPIFNSARQVAFFEYWTVDEERLRLDSEQTKEASELYGQEVLAWKSQRVVICEDSLERLLLTGKAFNAVSVSGGSRIFRREWVTLFRDIPEVFICFKRSSQSQGQAEAIAGLIPHARVVPLPPEVGEGGGLHEFFEIQGHSRSGFLELLGEATNDPVYA